MKIVIFNGNADPGGTGFDVYLESLSQALHVDNGGGHDVEVIRLRELDLKSCNGCFGCWVKTPGECVQRDDQEELNRKMIDSDLVLFASPIVMGFTSSLLRRASERFIPLLLPYLKLIDGEVRHEWRYARKARFGLLLHRGEGDDTDDEDLEIIRAVYEQIAIEAQTNLSLVMLTDSPAEEVANAINNI